MEDATVVRELRKLIASRRDLVKSISRKRWKPSEKAMACADHLIAIDALEFAAGYITAQTPTLYRPKKTEG